ncbi:MAG: hypothetical protein MUE34_17620 [Acidimicrobiales bacterium]|jgi:flagellar operon protein|nr:hypothetical protein [Acidimicrobiales bacterium]
MDRIATIPGPGPAANSPPGATGEATAPAAYVPGGPSGTIAGTFADILRQLDGGRPVAVSGHALRRLEQRGIEPPAEHAERLAKAFETLAARGGRQSLVMLDSVAYVVRVPERVVVTALGPDAGRERVFTQIDSVLVDQAS